MKTSELKRYIRQVQLENFGPEAQERLTNAKVLIIGAGGLGNPVATYLVSAGVGGLDIMDHDVVEESNLHRQPVFTPHNIGRSKASVLSMKVKELNPFCKSHAFEEKFSIANRILVADYDLIIDCTDNFTSRYLISDACEMYGRPFVFGAAEGWHGQVSVFNYVLEDGIRSPSYRSLFPAPPENPVDCNTVGVMATIPAVVGSLMANEAIKCISGIGKPLAGVLLTVDLLNALFSAFMYSELKITSKPKELARDTEWELTAEEYMAKKDKYKLVDIREEFEFELENAGGVNIPYYNLLDNPSALSSQLENILICESGRKSEIVTRQLHSMGIQNVKSMKGGLRGLLELFDT